jgi:membrane protein DedA with SNARE-associated domain
MHSPLVYALEHIFQMNITLRKKLKPRIKKERNNLSAQISLFVSHFGSLAIFILMTLESACIPIPSEIVMPYAGYMSFLHQFTIWDAVLIATIANVVGGWIAYAIGFFGGRPFVLRYGKYILLNENHLQRAERWFAKRGELTVLVARLLPGLRTFISLPAGMARMPLGRFTLYSAIGSLPWNIVLTLAGFQLGQHWSMIDKSLKPLTYFGVVLLIATVLWFWFGRRPESSRRNSS